MIPSASYPLCVPIYRTQSYRGAKRIPPHGSLSQLHCSAYNNYSSIPTRKQKRSKTEYLQNAAPPPPPNTHTQRSNKHDVSTKGAHTLARLSIRLSVWHTLTCWKEGGREGDKLQALVYDILPSAGRRCSECGRVSEGLEGGTRKKKREKKKKNRRLSPTLPLVAAWLACCQMGQCYRLLTLRLSCVGLSLRSLQYSCRHLRLPNVNVLLECAL